MHKQYRTRCKLSILGSLQSHPDERFSAAQLCELLQQEGHGFNLTTIYRNLERMTEDGTLLRFRNGREDVYQYGGQENRCQEHLHIQCGKCGRMVHLEGPAMERFSQAVEEDFGFSLSCGESALYGLCEDCRGGQKT